MFPRSINPIRLCARRIKYCRTTKVRPLETTLPFPSSSSALLHTYTPGHPDPTQSDRHEALLELRREYVMSGRHPRITGNDLSWSPTESPGLASPGSIAGRASEVTDQMYLRDMWIEGYPSDVISEEISYLKDSQEPYVRAKMDEADAARFYRHKPKKGLTYCETVPPGN